MIKVIRNGQNSQKLSKAIQDIVSDLKKDLLKYKVNLVKTTKVKSIQESQKTD